MIRLLRWVNVHSIKDRTRFPFCKSIVQINENKTISAFLIYLTWDYLPGFVLTFRTHNQMVNCCSLSVCHDVCLCVSELYVLVLSSKILFVRWCRTVHHRINFHHTFILRCWPFVVFILVFILLYPQMDITFLYMYNIICVLYLRARCSWCSVSAV